MNGQGRSKGVLDGWRQGQVTLYLYEVQTDHAQPCNGGEGHGGNWER